MSRKFQGLLGPKKELWDILQLVEKFSPEAQDMTSSIRDLPTVRYKFSHISFFLEICKEFKKTSKGLQNDPQRLKMVQRL